MLLDKSIHVQAPPERVFAWLDPSRMPLWDRSVVRAAPRDVRPLREGSVIDLVSRALGLRFESASEATRVEAGHVYAWRQLDGDFEAHEGAFTLEPEAGGTRVRLRADVELPFVLPRLATEAEVQRSLSRDADEALFRLKELVEKAG
ncbi:MAG TPA: SRPBCC family protein [Candidatus Thermoplasmatota archaeon]|nr:SRPBCC family protein [Candidatus Thermoplasmatota archaeon]